MDESVVIACTSATRCCRRLLRWNSRVSGEARRAFMAKFDTSRTTQNTYSDEIDLYITRFLRRAPTCECRNSLSI